MWRWDQSAGTLSRNGVVVSRGYSGRDRGKNNPSMQAAAGVGPLPRGRWRMLEVYNSKTVGQYAIKLDPVDARPGDDVHQPTGRSAFRIHGDSVKNPGTASHGCIILPRNVREQVWRSGDHELEVVE